MKKTHKQFLGCLGLGAVATMTAVAIFLPAPQASAVTTITDNISIYVESVAPVIGNLIVTTSDTTEVQQKETITDPQLTVKTSYESVGTLHYSLTYSYTNTDGAGQTVYDPLMEDYNADYEAGTLSRPLNLADEQFNINGTHGYGHYVLTVTGTGQDGVTDEKSFEFYYAPFLSSAEQNDGTGEIDINITDIDTQNVDTIDVYVNGELVGTITVDSETAVYNYTPDDPTVEQDFVIVLVANDNNGNPMFIGDEMNVHYTPLTIPDTGPDDDSDAGSPDTGVLFRNLNVSREDYLITGLIAFFVVGIICFGVVARGRKENRSNKRR